MLPLERCERIVAVGFGDFQTGLLKQALKVFVHVKAVALPEGVLPAGGIDVDVFDSVRKFSMFHLLLHGRLSFCRLR